PPRSTPFPYTTLFRSIGTCQNEFGAACAWLIEALNAVTGHLDREGGLMFPEPAADASVLARLLIGNVYGRWKSRVRGLPEFLGRDRKSTRLNSSHLGI